MHTSVRDRFHGCLFGLACGDALGARFEAQDASYIRSRFQTVRDLIKSVSDELWYTDDTQMAIAVTEVLASDRAITEQRLCEAFVANYVPSRGYGRGARAVLEAMEDGKDHRAVAQRYFPGGSYGNGAAMRVAPVGLFFRDDYAKVLAQSRTSAFPTHVHPLGVEGAQLLALAVAVASNMRKFDSAEFFRQISLHCQSPEFTTKIQNAAAVTNPSALASLGNGIEAVESVPTAIACFALFPDSYEETIGTAILLGGDTDTIAAMAGAISGAHLGIGAIPSAILDRLEDSPKGRRYLTELADRMVAAYSEDGSRTIDTQQ